MRWRLIERMVLLRRRLNVNERMVVLLTVSSSATSRALELCKHRDAH